MTSATLKEKKLETDAHAVESFNATLPKHDAISLTGTGRK